MRQRLFMAAIALASVLGLSARNEIKKGDINIIKYNNENQGIASPQQP